MSKALDLVLKPQAQEILERLSEIFQTHVVFYSAAGEELSAGRRNCRFCALLQEKLGFAAACSTLDRMKRREAARTRRQVTYRCHAGLHESVIPVYVVDDLVGYVMIGQLRSGRNLPRAIADSWNRTRGDADLQRAFDEIPLHEAGRIAHILGLFEMLVRFITDLHLVAVRSRNVLEPALTYMHNHIDDHITLSALAARLYRSPSTLSHQFKRLMGKSFKQVQAEMIVAKATEYFEHAPDIAVSEVAYRLGFTDTRYFARVFKKIAGVPPSAARSKRRAPR
jgi:AraC-like DNA-binding protein/ligand-binding sensor protein